MKRNRMEIITRLARRQAVIRPRDLDKYEIPRTYLRRLTDRGVLKRVGRGLYMLADTDVSQHHSLAEACKRIPKGVVCLLSALQFHELTTQSPHEIWLAVNRDECNWVPRVNYPPVRILKFSATSAREGIEKHKVQGVPVRVYNPAKTVADCFKYRNKIGLDVALEALRDSWKQKKASMDEFWKYAQICRVSNVMRPYLESLV